MSESTRSVVVERVFPHPVEKLWRALTESPLLTQWLMGNDFDAVPGHSFQFRSQAMPGWDGIISCKVLEVEPLKQLRYTWAALGLESVVLFTLTPVEGGTQLRVEQSGFTPSQDRAFHGASYAWPNFLGGLEKLLDGGAV